MKHLPSRSRVVSIVCNCPFKCAVSLSLSLSLSLSFSLSSLSIVYSADDCDSGTEEHALLTSELLAIIHSEKARHERVLQEVEYHVDESDTYDFAYFMEALSELGYEWPPNDNFLHEDYTHDACEAMNYIDILPRLPTCPSWYVRCFTETQHRHTDDRQHICMQRVLGLWCVPGAFAHDMCIR